ncbi:serine/threonine-protein phosphatase [Candidatus Gracilibacteria bacterium 28_42_T64]|nr:serine/threonine-protein phosphatase [Candidatus Gracilibacteria bacterium 28_42_T64]
MFNIFKKKKINTQAVKSFNEVVKTIDIFIRLSEWEKARMALAEIRNKEKKSLADLMIKIESEDKLFSEKEVIKQNKFYKKKLVSLDKLEETLIKTEKKFHDDIQNQKFKIRFKSIKTEIELLAGGKKHTEAMNLLQKFLEENKEKDIVIKFFNKEKKILLKKLEKHKGLEQEKIKRNAKSEAMNLIGENVNIEPKEKKKKKSSFFSELKEKINFYKKIKETIRKKKLLSEINILIDEDSKVKNDIAAKKLANIHRGLIKEITNDQMLGYELYGKILGADKISGDTFGFNENTSKYNFFLGDATGHGIRAGFIVTLLSRFFNKYVDKSSLSELTYEINNGLKQDLKNRNFITGVFFEILKNKIGTINFVGMGHEPMLIFRKKENTIEKVIPGGLAAGIRMIKNKEDIKTKELNLGDEDILIIYSDGMTDSKNPEGSFYGIDRLKDSFFNIASGGSDIKNIYDFLINDIQLFRGGSSFDDDVSILMIKRNFLKDIVREPSEYLDDLSKKEGLKRNDVKKMEGKTKEEINVILESIKKEKETKKIIKILENLYFTGEILKLKQEAIRFIKAGYIHKKINYYLKKAIDNEKGYKIDQKNQRIDSKYTVLMELYKKGDYKTVMQEVEDIIAQDGNI